MRFPRGCRRGEDRREGGTLFTPTHVSLGFVGVLQMIGVVIVVVLVRAVTWGRWERWRRDIAIM